MPKLWTLPPPAPDHLWFDLLDVPRFVIQTLYNRGVRSASGIEAFLRGEETATVAGVMLKDTEVAARRVQSAIAGGERIAVYADFDVDGVCSAVILEQTLRALQAQVQVYIPHRVEEGYGLNKPAISHLAEQGVRLLITADCGTSSRSEIEHANILGLDVIVTDHHHVPASLPPALALLNPHRPDCPYHFKELAGVGVAYKLAVALLSGVPGASAAGFLDLVALGTIVDVAPLVGENRWLARQGLAAMRTAPRPGLQALMEQARVRPEDVSAGHLGFAIGPRLNAAGRIGSARTSYDLLQCAAVEQARPLAMALEEQNQERQRLLEAALASARQEAAEQVKQSPLVFVASETYRAGIVGLVAGRLAEEFYRPAVAVERGAELSRGSCRSIPGFHMARALDECAQLLERHGGHEQAAGFTVQTARLPELQESLASVAKRELSERSLAQVVRVDAVLPLAEASWDTWRWLQRLQPFGAGNPAPVLQSSGVRVRQARLAGNNHLRLSVTDGRLTWDAIAFRQGPLAESLGPGDRIDIVYNLEDQAWNGEQSLQLVILDLRKSA